MFRNWVVFANCVYDLRISPHASGDVSSVAHVGSVCLCSIHRVICMALSEFLYIVFYDRPGFLGYFLVFSHEFGA